MTINPITATSFTTQDVDRILGIADQFLEDWEVDANADNDIDNIATQAERATEFAALRPLLVAAPDLIKALRAAEARLTLLIDSQRGGKLLDVTARDECRAALASVQQ